MSVMFSSAIVLLGLVLLLRGANDLVEGASGLAMRLGVSRLVVGLTVVAIGTSAPELVTSVLGAIRAARGEAGAASVVVGNMLGSNACNVGVILGLSAVIAPVAVSPVVRRRDVPLLLLLTGLFAAAAWWTGLDRLTGALVLVVFLACSAWIVASEMRGRHADHGEDRAVEQAVTEIRTHSATRSVLEVAAGLVLLVLGAWLLVEGAVRLARLAGTSEAVIGLTVVAVGTSLPELATSIAAARRGDAEIALGNVVGSNAVNIGAGIGLPALITPLHADPLLIRVDMPVTIAFTVLLAALCRRPVIGRVAGAVLLLAYAAYVAVRLALA